MTRSKTLVVVGCGAAKADEARPAQDLYTSTYFAKKREYAEVVGDDWGILSAEHGLLDPYEVIDPYETSIDDLDEDELNKLAGEIGLSLIDLVSDELVTGQGFEEIVVLAGRRYLDPLRERDTFAAGISETVTFPLQQNDLAGIGEQMAWLSERVSRESAEQTRLVTDGGEDLSDTEDARPGRGDNQIRGRTDQRLRRISSYRPQHCPAVGAKIRYTVAHTRECVIELQIVDTLSTIGAVWCRNHSTILSKIVLNRSSQSGEYRTNRAVETTDGGGRRDR